MDFMTQQEKNNVQIAKGEIPFFFKNAKKEESALSGVLKMTLLWHDL